MPPPPPPPHPWRLGYAGLGPIVLGMTLDEASRAAGVAITPTPDCEGGAHGVADNIYFTHRANRIVRLSIKNPEFLTISGARVGNTEEDILRAYPFARPAAGDHQHPVLRITSSSGAEIDFSLSPNRYVTAISAAPNATDAREKPACD